MSDNEWVRGEKPSRSRPKGMIRVSNVGGNHNVVRPLMFGPEPTEADIEQVAESLQSEYEFREPLRPELERAFPVLNERAEFLNMLKFAMYDADTAAKTSDVLRGGVIKVGVPEAAGVFQKDVSLNNGVLTVSPNFSREVREQIAFVLQEVWRKRFNTSDNDVIEN